MTSEHRELNKSVTLGLSMLGGLGLTLMVAVAAVGVIGDPSNDTQTLGLIFITGLIILVVAIIAWVAYVQPFKNFDDINVPLEEEAH